MTVERREWKRRPYRTTKQKKIMGKLLHFVGQGRRMTVRDLFYALPRIGSYDAFRKSLEGLERGGFILRQQHAGQTWVDPTQLGYDWFRPEK